MPRSYVPGLKFTATIWITPTGSTLHMPRSYGTHSIFYNACPRIEIRGYNMDHPYGIALQSRPVQQAFVEP